MNSESGRKLSMEELKERNQTIENMTTDGAATQPAQTLPPIVIQCPLPEALTELTQRTSTACRELHEIRQSLPELHTPTNLTAVQNSLTEMQRLLRQMTFLLEQAGSENAKRSCKWMSWLPDFNFLTPVKWIALALVLTSAGLAMWYGAATVLSGVRNLLP